MSWIENIKRILFTEDTISQKFITEKMKIELDNIKKEYEELINLQSRIKEKPKIMSEIKMAKKDKYIELMDDIKYKDVNLIKDYEMYAMRYNILVELYNKLKDYIAKSDEELKIDFAIDKYKQPVAIVSHNQGIINKIILIKNTFSEYDYIKYKIDENVEILEIKSSEQNVSHGTFMMNMLTSTIEKINVNGKKINTISISDNLMKEFGINNCFRFFKKFGFEINENTLMKKV